jgi:hypothetical protein
VVFATAENGPMEVIDPLELPDALPLVVEKSQFLEEEED